VTGVPGAEVHRKASVVSLMSVRWTRSVPVAAGLDAL
jgi:hypothetical protein